MKTIWIWRLIAVIIILVFAMLMWNLYARLVKLQQQQSSADSRQSTVAVTLHFSDPSPAAEGGGLSQGEGKSTLNLEPLNLQLFL